PNIHRGREKRGLGNFEDSSFRKCTRALTLEDLRPPSHAFVSGERRVRKDHEETHVQSAF
ncbi:MAG: hypothetical protein ACK55Z_35275, partial [bacterium]